MRPRRTPLIAALFAALLLMTVGIPVSAQFSLENPRVTPGIEVLLEEEEFLSLVRGKRVGLITNQTGVDRDLVSTVDLLHEHPEINLVKLFGPEHGVRGAIHAGVKVDDEVDPKTGIPMFSLYGATRRPPAEYLEQIDVMLYDIQDIGSRSYTYIYTMAYAMEECGKAGIPFVVLDRPNPCGNIVSGNVLDESQGTSFVGLYGIPYMYGMTPGETAMLFNKEFNEVECELTVVPMRGYVPTMKQWDTGLAFVPTSPNIPQAKTAFYYNLTGIIGELFDVSIGVGYPLAFEIIAAPWIDRDEFVDALRAKDIPHLKVMPVTLVPYASRFEGETIQGAHFFITNYNAIRPVEAQIHIMEVLQRLYPDQGLFAEENSRRAMFDKVMGDREIRRAIAAGRSAEEIIASYQQDVAEFMTLRAQYLIYEE